MRHALPVFLLLTALAPAALFRGRVLDAYTRRPVPWAEVEVFALNVNLLADERGEFGFEAGNATVTLDISRIGYANRSWTGLRPGEPVELYLLPEVISLEGVTVTAFRTPVPLDRSGPVTVVGRDKAARSANTDLAGALRATVSAVGRDNINFSSVTLRGTNAEHVLVAVDGIRLNSAQNGTFDLTTMPLALADRIEVTRGGNSSLYGTSPVGGMVNVLTPDPDRFNARLRAGVGALGERHVEATHEGRLGGFGYALGGNWSRIANDFSYDDGAGGTATITNADRSSLGGFGKALYSSGAHRASLLAELSSSARGVPGPRNWPSDDARRDDRRGLVIGRYAFQPDERQRAGVAGYWLNGWQNYREKRDTSPFPANPPANAGRTKLDAPTDFGGTQPGVGNREVSQFFPATDDTHRLASSGLHLDAALYPAAWALVMAGLELDQHDLRSTAVGAPGRLDIAGWAQARFEFGGFAATPQTRFEALRQSPPSETLGAPATLTVFSPKLTLGWTALDQLNVFAGAGRSFRAPSLNDLYWPGDAWSYGNPELRPEFGTGFDLGLGVRAADFLAWRVGGYRTALTDLIQWQPDSTFRYRPVNVTAATITGIEAEANLDLDFVGLDANVNWSRAESDGERLYYRPDLTARATLWGRAGFRPLVAQLDFGVEHSGNRLSDPVWPGTEPRTLAGYTLLDATAALNPRLVPVTATARFGVRNVLDQRYQTVDFYPNPGRTWFSELELGI